jgi:hypothetical protein
MMRKLLLILFCFQLSFVYSQSVGLEYIAVYKTEITTKLLINFNTGKLKSKEDSILAEFGESFMKEMSQREISFMLIDSLKTKGDTTFIKTIADSKIIAESNVSIGLNLKGNERVLVDNKFFIKK